MSIFKRHILDPEKRKKRIRIVLWVIGIIIFISILTGPYGVYQRVIIAGHKHQLETQIEKLKAEQEWLKSEREKLKWDLAYIEKVAREKYSLVRPGERVYQFIPRTVQPVDPHK